METLSKLLTSLYKEADSILPALNSNSSIQVLCMRLLTMTRIRDLSQIALETGFLTIEAEEQLRRLLTTTQYELEDLNAFMALQKAAMIGEVKQESRERLKVPSY